MSQKQNSGVHSTDRHFVSALARGLKILQCYDRHHNSLSMADLVAQTGLPQPTVWRLCYTLQKLGYLKTDPTTNQLHLGPAAMMFGAATLSTRQTVDMARPLIQNMADKYHCAVAIGEHHTDYMVYMLRCQGDSPLLMNLHIGSAIPLYESAIGHAYIASASPEEQQSFLNKAREISDSVHDQILNAIQSYQQKGYVTLYRPQHHINTIATTFSLDDGRRYAINCGGPAALLTESMIEDQVAADLVKLSKGLKPLFLFGQRSV
ncbi:IclR family transcriptional regulator [Orrella sp. 11846]|uniref:IclR family transcriptional regulator n=1 Tax=Orrella sp. 11846 TaxID=3409913 RepID=UPI003B5ABD13